MAWEGGGLRIALAVDAYIYFANIRCGDLGHLAFPTNVYRTRVDVDVNGGVLDFVKSKLLIFASSTAACLVRKHACNFKQAVPQTGVPS